MEDLGEDLDITVSTSAPRRLYDANKECEKLDEKRAVVFHSITAKTLFIMKRIRPDLEPTVAFLCTRVPKSDKVDWKKLKRMLGFVKHTIDDIHIIGTEILTDLYTWIDAAYAVHPNMRSQTGGAMSFGVGIVHGKSIKQKLNT
eukprot:10925329-Ditylum_brightwellii.AAC.1